MKRSRGNAKGNYEKGYDEGFEAVGKAYNDGYNEGFEKGKAVGKAEAAAEAKEGARYQKGFELSCDRGYGKGRLDAAEALLRNNGGSCGECQRPLFFSRYKTCPLCYCMLHFAQCSNIHDCSERQPEDQPVREDRSARGYAAGRA